MSAPSLSVQLITISIITLQRQLIHNQVASRTQWNSTYDYIVVGAGSAGCIVAARLSEDPTVNVLLVEAGGPQTVITDMLANAWIGITITSENDWGYLTVPQRRAGFAFKDRRMIYPRGRVLGGSSTTNYGIYNRGNRRDFDNWANEFGATGWSYDEILPYFLRTENNTNPQYVAQNPRYHSTSGQMPIASSPNPDPILLRYMEGWGQEGWPTIDFNGPTQRGTTLIQQAASPLNWTRASTASSFIEPARNRNNLHVITRTLVTKVLLRNSTNGLTAYGIEFIRNNNNYTVYASSEVILSAGATNTPQILMLSGIGPRQHLQDLNIPVVLDLPVGNNLQDHILIPVDYMVENESDIQWARNLDTVNNVQNLYDYYVNNDGPITQLPTVLTYHDSRFNDNPDWPDGIRATLTSQIGTNLTEVLTYKGSNLEEWADYYRPLLGNQRHFWVYYAVYRPRSRGSVRLQSNNPRDPPLIDPNYFADNYDLGVTVDAMSTGMRMTEGPYFRRFGRIYNKTIPGCRLCDSGPYYNCYSYLACVAQTVTSTSYHPVGTCRMGNSSDPSTVVDSHLRVRGVRGLRVIDASIMPKINNANTNAASMMIGERGSDFVRSDRKLALQR